MCALVESSINLTNLWRIYYIVRTDKSVNILLGLRFDQICFEKQKSSPAVTWKIEDWNKKVLKANDASIYKGEQLGIKAVRQETDS